MTKVLREELFNLSAAERLELIEELWDSIADDDQALALRSEQREDLDRRLREIDEHSEQARPWEEVRERILSRKRD